MSGQSGSDTPKKLTLRDRKKAQPLAKRYFSDEEKKSIVETVAKNLTDAQRGVFFYTCQAMGLNPLLNEICAVVYHGKEGSKMSIQVQRDGFLTIAHRSGKFAGLESGVTVNDQGKIINGWARVYHKDFNKPVYQEADFDEYDSPERNPIWKTKPKTMIKKVAESMALRKAFNVSGVYAPEEMDNEIEVAGEYAVPSTQVPHGDDPATEIQINSIKAMLKNLGLDGAKPAIVNFDGLTKQQAADTLKNLASQKKAKKA